MEQVTDIWLQRMATDTPAGWGRCQAPSWWTRIYLSGRIIRRTTHPEPLLWPVRGSVWPRVRDHACRCCACKTGRLQHVDTLNCRVAVLSPVHVLSFKEADTLRHHATHAQSSRIMQGAVFLCHGPCCAASGFRVCTCVLGIQAQGRQQRGVSVRRQPLRQERDPIPDRHSNMMSGTAPHSFAHVCSHTCCAETCRAQALAFAALAGRQRNRRQMWHTMRCYNVGSRLCSAGRSTPGSGAPLGVHSDAAGHVQGSGSRLCSADSSTPE
jgi:hypothetical protein